MKLLSLGQAGKKRRESNERGNAGQAGQTCLAIFLAFMWCLLFAGLPQSAHSAVLWSDNFESGGGDWHTDFGAWEIGVPSETIGPGAAYTPTKCAATILAGNYTNNISSRLIRHVAFTVPAANQNPRLRFWQWYDIAPGDYGVVEIKVDGHTSWTEISGRYSRTSHGAWIWPVIDLKAYAGQSVQIAFYFYSGSSVVSSGWYIDDVTVETGNIVFSNPENWESGWGDWYADYGVWAVGTPEITVGPGAAYNGSQCAATSLTGDYPNDVDSRLISPTFVVPSAADNPRLRFWQWYDIAPGDYGVVQIKAAGHTSWTEISGRYSRTSSGMWTRPFIDLSAYASQNVQIAFYFYSGSSVVSSGWYIDDMTIEPNAPPQTLVSVNPTSRDVAKEAGTTTFNVSNTGTGTMLWTAAVTSGGTWLSITSGASGSNAGTITCAFTANTSTSPRTGTIRVTATGAIGSPVDVTVTQAGSPALLVSPTSRDVAKEEGTTTFSVSNTGAGTMPWTAAVTSGETWLSITSGANGSNAGTITCAFTVNTSTSPRTGTIRVTAAGAIGSPKDVTVTQAGSPALSVSPTSRDVAKEAGTTTFSVSNTGAGTMPWTAAVTSGGTWLSNTSGASGSNAGTISCAFTANTSTSPRTGTIRVTATGAIGSPKDVTVTQAGTPASDFCIRSVQGFYIPGVSLTVTLSANPTSGISNFAVEDTPPAGWTVSNLSGEGYYDAVNHKVKFGPLFDSNPKTWTYDATPPVGTSGIQTFHGTISMDGTGYPIGGVSEVDLGAYHPADNSPDDFIMVIDEMTAYGASWKQGTVWPVAPNPIPISYVTKAGQLWKLGENYVYDPSAGNPPLCWVNSSHTSAILAKNDALLSTAVCDMPQVYNPGQAFTVTITVTPVSDVSTYAVEDLIPADWTISNISDGGSFDAVNGKVKFGPFVDNASRNLTYHITPPVTASGKYNFAGVASFDGNDIAVSGVREITQAAPKLSDVVKGLQVLAGVDVDISNSLADANGDGKVEMSDVLENLMEISGLK